MKILLVFLISYGSLVWTTIMIESEGCFWKYFKMQIFIWNLALKFEQIIMQ
jgi:hypothetical protein